MTIPTTELRALLEKATPNPWGIEQGSDCAWVGPLRHDGKVAAIACKCDGGPESGYNDKHTARLSANAALIVAAVNALPALLSAAEELERVKAELREAERFIVNAVAEMGAAAPHLDTHADSYFETMNDGVNFLARCASKESR